MRVNKSKTFGKRVVVVQQEYLKKQKSKLPIIRSLLFLFKSRMEFL
jgi:hypothetical protein